MTMKSERVFLIVLLIMMVILLSSCTLLDKLRGNLGVPDMLTTVPDTINVETPTAEKDVRG